ncbi:MAG: serine/threonine-protein kinase [Polyangia bacterium]
MSVSGSNSHSGSGSSGSSGSGSGQRRSKSIPPPRLGRDRIGRYEVIYPLAVGGMAGVHVGRLSGMAGFEKLVAIKVIHPHLAVKSEFVDMFLDEARLAARIHHPNVGEILEIGEDGGLLFMVQELIQGRDLRQLFRRAKSARVRVSQGMCAYICAQVCAGLHVAHELRDQDGHPLHLVHRDISPRNVLVTYDGFVKLIDFGVASARGRIAQTESEGLKGKLGFMSPEQLRGHKIDRRSDVFSLGVVLYLMTTGMHPFPGNTEAERVDSVLHSEIVSPRRLNPEVRPELERIVLKAMARDRVERYSTALELGGALEQFVATCGDRVGSAALSAMMSTLFNDKIAEHEIRLRAFRKRRGDSTGTQKAVDAPSLAADEAEDVTGPGTPVALRRSERITPPPSRSRLKPALLLGGGGVALAVIAALLIAVFSAGGETGADVEKNSAAGDGRDLEAASAVASGGDGESEATGERGGSESVDSTAGEKKAAGAAAAEPEPEEEPATVSIALSLLPEDASVEVDGRDLGSGLEQIELPADDEEHVVRVTSRGHQAVEKKVAADRDRELTIHLKRLPPVSKPSTKKARPKRGGSSKKKPKKPKKSGEKKKSGGLLDSPYQ